MTAIDFGSVSFTADRAAVAIALQQVADRYLDGMEPTVAEAVRYALMGEGKRLRAILLIAAYRASGGTGDASGLAAAVEVVHAYSLVHDDLPCMDDDDVRRGRPTVHKAFTVSAATAAGLAMVPMAARAACDAAMTLVGDPRVAGEIVRTLMSASGAGGMIGGQLLDLEGEGDRIGSESTRTGASPQDGRADQCVGSDWRARGRCQRVVLGGIGTVRRCCRFGFPDCG